MTTMSSTLGLYMAYENSIETVAVKVRANQETELKYCVWMPEDVDGERQRLIVYSATIHLFRTEDFHWVALPVNLYTHSKELYVELKGSPDVEVAKETFEDHCISITE